MKNSVKLILSLLILSSLVFFTQCARKQATEQGRLAISALSVTPIILIVDTENIPTQGNFDYNNYCYFLGQKPNQTVEDFLKEVSPEEDIEWLGVSEQNSPTEKVLIKMVKFKKGKKILDKDSYEDEDRGIVFGKVKRESQVNDGDEEDYTIHFKIQSEQNPSNRMYIIDPKLQVVRR